MCWFTEWLSTELCQFWSTRNPEYKKTDCTNSVQSSLKSHSLWESCICMVYYFTVCTVNTVYYYTGCTVYSVNYYTGCNVNRVYCIQGVLYTGCTVYRVCCIQYVLYTECTVYRVYYIQGVLNIYMNITVYWSST